ncbi:hypothetical protein JOF35_005238 [Streptomyces demainii]|uniref:Uncharacterized protein n=1 Tax=Streptomyces demainii TaxID=588122 RepID=A0ABT9KWZ3_9ACTN|nr:hypothetical protein [Streptomyces demainii]
MRGALFESVFNFTHFHVLKELARDHGFELVARASAAAQSSLSRRVLAGRLQRRGRPGPALPRRGVHRRAGGTHRWLLRQGPGRPHGHPDEQHAARTCSATTNWRAHRAVRRTARGDPAGTLLDAFARQVSRRPGGTAVSHGTRHLDYRALDSESDRVAASCGAPASGGAMSSPYRWTGGCRGPSACWRSSRREPSTCRRSRPIRRACRRDAPPQRLPPRAAARRAHTGELAPALVAAGPPRRRRAPLTVLELRGRTPVADTDGAAAPPWPGRRRLHDLISPRAPRASPRAPSSTTAACSTTSGQVPGPRPRRHRPSRAGGDPVLRHLGLAARRGVAGGRPAR